MAAVDSLVEPVFLRATQLLGLHGDELQPLLAHHNLSGSSPGESLDHRDAAARDLINGARVWSGVEGTSWGLGGALAMVPNLVSLLRTQLRLVQSLSAIYDVPHAAKEEQLEAWRVLLQGLGARPLLAASSGALSARMAQALIRQATKRVLSSLGVDRASPALVARFIPLVGAAAQGYSNAELTAEVGAAAARHYRERFLAKYTIDG
jgi:hypothetical protein